MRESIEHITIACDGVVFRGPNQKEACILYEKEVMKNLENDMKGNVNIYNLNGLFDNKQISYIRFLTDEGKKLFLRWCDYHKLHIHEDNVNSLEINKWYAGTTDNDLYYVTFDETDIVTQLQELKNLCYTLSYIDSSKIFISNGGVPSDFER